MRIHVAAVCALALMGSAVAAAAEKPKLGVLIVIDQLNADDFEAKLPRAKAGFKRLATEGYRVFDARFEAAPTVTAVGHATLSTGAYGDTHGIVANEWIDADSGKPRLSAEDPAFHIIGREPKARECTAPTWLRAPTLGDTVRASHELAKAVTISGKDRSAILVAGHSATGVFWFDSEKPMFVTSDYYAKELPPFVVEINARIAAAVEKGSMPWGAPAGSAGRPADSEPNAEAPALQPMLDRLEVDVALGAVKAYELGKDDVVDLLAISFSGHDRIGHAVGPEAPEALAEFDNVDAEIGRLLAGLDAAVGKGRYVVALSADHGVAPVPEVALKRGLDAGRVDTKGLLALLKKEAEAALGPGEYFAGMRVPGPWVVPAQRAKVLGIADRLRKVAQAQPGVLDLLPLTEVLKPGACGSVCDLYRHGAVPGRAPDFIVVTKPYWLFGTGDPTGHSTSYLYDRSVPLLFFGAGVKKGFLQRAEPIDAVPTLARLMGVPPPTSSTGHVLDVSH